MSIGCLRCGSDRMIYIETPNDETVVFQMYSDTYFGFPSGLPSDFGLSDSESLTIMICLDCGQAQCDEEVEFWPRPLTTLEKEYSGIDDIEDDNLLESGWSKST